MRYADRYCQIVSVGPHYVVTGKDIFSGRDVVIHVPSKELYDYRQGAMAQDAFKSLNASEREFLISGMYDSFPEDEDIE